MAVLGPKSAEWWDKMEMAEELLDGDDMIR